MTRKEIEEKILELEKKIFSKKNSCAGLQNEFMESFESDLKYLEILKNKLTNSEKIFCEKCGEKIEEKRLKINPEAKKCSKCK